MSETGGLILRNDSGTAYNTAYTLRLRLALRDIPTSSGRRICGERYTQFQRKALRQQDSLKM